MLKTCTKCKKEKGMNDFCWDKTNGRVKSQCRECDYKRSAVYYKKTPRYHIKAIWRKASDVSRKNHTKKWEARAMVTKALFRGELKRGLCNLCDNPKTHGHHEDYSRPLDVMWLCTKHHFDRHKEMRVALIGKSNDK